MQWYRSIGSRTILYVAVTAVVVKGAFSIVNLRIQEDHLRSTILTGASQLSETIKKSITYDMLENRKQNAYRIMDTIGEQNGIDAVRIYGREGKIIFSTDKTELGGMVDKQAAACVACHSETQPLDRLTAHARGRIYQVAGGERVLGMINPIYNDRGCSTADCHVHPDSQKVLGVIDVVMSLAEADREMRGVRIQTIVTTLLSIIVIATIIGVIFQRFIGKPIRELVNGTRRIAGGDLEYAIPITTDDEMGYLARSFNVMTEKLRSAREEIRGLIRGLEGKVEERTRELTVAQARLLQSEKLAALGKIAATVAHEINNPLSGVFTYIKLMERKIDDGGPPAPEMAQYREFLSTMSREVERTTSIVRNLLDFARPKEPSRKKVTLSRIMEETLALIRNQIGISNIRVSLEMDPLPETLADPSQLKQVFLNVLVNACEAMEQGGALSIRGRRGEDGRTLVVDISDTGMGIAPENLSRIFDPFFTTKDKGTGVGLSVVMGIMEKHHGTVDVESEVGKGTRVRLVFPIVTEEGAP